MQQILPTRCFRGVVYIVKLVYIVGFQVLTHYMIYMYIYAFSYLFQNIRVYVCVFIGMKFCLVILKCILFL